VPRVETRQTSGRRWQSPSRNQLELASNPAPERTLLDLIRAPFVIFRRALERGNYLVVAEATAEELPQLSLIDALELTLLVAREGPAPLLTALFEGELERSHTG
jgi:hypothetical protein